MSKNNMILEKIILEYKEKEDLETPLKSFKLHKKLNNEVWNGSKIKQEIQKRLLEIADDFYSDIKSDHGIDYQDVILTGSLANYNFSSYSDFDLHIMLDFTKISTDFKLVKRYFDSLRKIWNDNHDITILNFDVEVYLQDINEEHKSSGIYSILNNEWVVKPSPFEDVIDIDAVRIKSKDYISDIEDVEVNLDELSYEEFNEQINRVWDKIKKGRQAGLETDGELSVENIVFKLLRRNGAITKIIEMKSKKYDEFMSM